MEEPGRRELARLRDKLPAAQRKVIFFLAVSFAFFLAFILLSATAAALVFLPIGGAVVTAVYAALALTNEELALMDEYALRDFHIAECVVALATSPRSSRSPNIGSAHRAFSGYPNRRSNRSARPLAVCRVDL